MFENVVLRILGPRRDEVTGEWRRLHNEELNDLYSSPNIVRVIKLRRIRWAGHVAHVGEIRDPTPTNKVNTVKSPTNTTRTKRQRKTPCTRT